MKSNWTQQFREKLEGYQPDIPIPPFAIKTRRNPKALYWISAIAVAAMVSAIFFGVAIRPHNSVTVLTNHLLIGRADPVIRAESEWENLPIPSLKPYENIRRVPVFGIYEKGGVNEDLLNHVIESPPDSSVRSTDSQDLNRLSVGESERPVENPKGDELEPVKPFHKTDKRLSARIMIASESIMSSYEQHQGVGISDLIANEDISSNFTFKAGIHLGYAFFPGLVIESGLNYSNHTIQQRYTDMDKTVFETGQLQLHYLGVPMKLNIGIVRKARLSVYGAIGGEVSWLIKGSRSGLSDRLLLNQEIKGNPLLISSTGGVGLSYVFSPIWSVYIEPCVTYSYMPSGQVAYYANHPFGFDISLGLRFDL